MFYPRPSITDNQPELKPPKHPDINLPFVPAADTAY